MLKCLAAASAIPLFFTCAAMCSVGDKVDIVHETYTGSLPVGIACMTFAIAIIAFVAGKESNKLPRKD